MISYVVLYQFTALAALVDSVLYLICYRGYLCRLRFYAERNEELVRSLVQLSVARASRPGLTEEDRYQLDEARRLIRRQRWLDFLTDGYPTLATLLLSLLILETGCCLILLANHLLFYIGIYFSATGTVMAVHCITDLADMERTELNLEILIREAGTALRTAPDETPSPRTAIGTDFPEINPVLSRVSSDRESMRFGQVGVIRPESGV